MQVHLHSIQYYTTKGPQALSIVVFYRARRPYRRQSPPAPLCAIFVFI